MQHLLVNQPFPNFSFNRGGHDLSCDWLFMQQGCLSSWDNAPLWCGHKRPWEGDLVPLEWTEARGIKYGDKKYQLTTLTQTKLLSLLNKWMILENDFRAWVKLSQHTSFSLILLIGIFRSFTIIPWDKCHSTSLINFMINPLFQIMAWCHHTRSHYLNLCWPIFRRYISWLGHNEFRPKADFHGRPEVPLQIWFYRCEFHCKYNFTAASFILLPRDLFSPPRVLFHRHKFYFMAVE